MADIKNIRLYQVTYDRLSKIAGQMELECKKAVTFDDVVTMLLNLWEEHLQ